jgi:hypothetical protein
VRLRYPDHDVPNPRNHDPRKPHVTHIRLGLAAAAAALILTVPAHAATCLKMGFSVNDYGKDGPTRDAQALLDKRIVEWAKVQGIKKYKVGKKDVTCELYLDVGLFDEHTCKATANVCWTK